MLLTKPVEQEGNDKKQSTSSSTIYPLPAAVVPHLPLLLIQLLLVLLLCQRLSQWRQQ
jgi:hypothetical protein